MRSTGSPWPLHRAALLILPMLAGGAVLWAALPTGLTTVTLAVPPPVPCNTGGTCSYSSVSYSSARFDLSDPGGTEGVALASGADLNGDGRLDMVVGAGQAAGGKGQVYVFYGTSGTDYGTWGTGSSITFTGSNSGDALGTALAMGDVTGDGKADLVIGAPGATGSKGEVYVVKGGSSWTSQPDITGIGGLITLTGSPGDLAGRALAVGDVAKDGQLDLIVGGPGSSRVYLVYGPISSGAADQDITFQGVAGDQAGSAVAVAGDLNGDGSQDLVMGAPAAREGQGIAYLFNGRSKSDLSSAASGGVIRLDGTVVQLRTLSGDLTASGTKVGQLGYAVAGIGDVNGDGVADAALGAPFAPLSSSSAADDQTGRVYLILGGPNATSAAQSANISSLNSYLHGETAGDLLGSAIGPAGDVDKDGIVDFLVGAVHADSKNVTPGDANGAAYLVLGRKPWTAIGKGVTETPGVRFGGIEPGDSAGAAVAGAPLLDVDGDGYNDFFIAAPGFSGASGGRAYLILFGDFYDQDGDGQSRADGDCNEDDKSVKYVANGANETCDGKDNDCDGKGDDNDNPVQGQSTYYLDGDGDGYGNSPKSACSKPAGYVTAQGDCNDGDASINPGAQEICDAKDNDCDAAIDGADMSLNGTSYYPDGDGDHYGAATGSPVQGCSSSPPAGRVADHSDCNDTNAAINPAAQEVCEAGSAPLDNDCDGLIDDQDPSITGQHIYYADLDGDGFGDGSAQTKTCALSPPARYVTNSNDCNDRDAAVNPGAQEVCDGKDNDCDGLVDGDDPSAAQQSSFYPDHDGDGYGAGSAQVFNCTANPPGGYSTFSTDCNDGDAAIHPGAGETCNGIDDDCDGKTDDADDQVTGQNIYHPDVDQDGFGSSSALVGSCAATPPPGAVVDGADCDDSSPVVYPDAPEGPGPDPVHACLSADGRDNDCDGQIDEGTCASDDDGDGYAEIPAEGEPGAGGPGDCNDANAGVHPGALEACDEIDQDCDGDAVNGFDQDGDGHLSAAVCVGVPAGDDCDDADDEVYAGAVEVCDDKDNNCEGRIDEADDVDGDGYLSVDSCVGLGGGDDCDDSDAEVHPGALEICDALDNDCDGTVDNDFDGDGDGYVSSAKCAGYPGQTDCDDGAAAVHPGADDVCDGIDNNCLEGLQDERTDADGDGFSACDATAAAVDCDDAEALSYPGAVPVCDGVDHDCDGAADSGNDSFDLDGDGYLDVDQCGALAATEALDCDDHNDKIHPEAAELSGDGIDNNCDGELGPSDPAAMFQDAALGCSCDQGAGQSGRGTPGGLALDALLLGLVGGIIRRRGGRLAG